MDADTTFGYLASALIIFGGAMGYIKRGSVPSLVAGGASGGLLAYGVHLQTKNRKQVGLIVAASCLLLLVMGPKFARTGKVMPAGIVVLLSLAMLIRFGARLL